MAALEILFARQIALLATLATIKTCLARLLAFGARFTLLHALSLALLVKAASFKLEVIAFQRISQQATNAMLAFIPTELIVLNVYRTHINQQLVIKPVRYVQTMPFATAQVSSANLTIAPMATAVLSVEL